MDDKTIIHHLWWLNKFLNSHFEGKEYAQIIYEKLTPDITNEVNELVQHIKENY